VSILPTSNTDTISSTDRSAVGSKPDNSTPTGGSAASQTTGGGGGGTVTSVQFAGDGTVLSNTASAAVTSSGVLTATLSNAAAATFLAGPLTGNSTLPTYRAMARTDLAGMGNISVTYVTARRTPVTGNEGSLTFVNGVLTSFVVST